MRACLMLLTRWLLWRMSSTRQGMSTALLLWELKMTITTQEEDAEEEGSNEEESHPPQLSWFLFLIFFCYVITRLRSPPICIELFINVMEFFLFFLSFFIYILSWMPSRQGLCIFWNDTTVDSCSTLHVAFPDWSISQFVGLCHV